MMTNILYVIWSLGLGGAEQVVINLARGLDKSRFRPFIACLNDEGRFADELKKDGIEVFALDKARGIDFSVVPKLVAIIRENNIRLVHAHLWGANFWGRLAARKALVPVVVTEHGIQEYRTPAHFFLDRWLSRSTEKVIFVCAFTREHYWRRICCAYEKTCVIYNGVESVVPEPGAGAGIKRELGIQEGEAVLAVIGRLAPEKGHAFFLEAFKGLLERGRCLPAACLPARQGQAGTVDRGLKALIVGDGPLEQSLKSQVRSLKLEDKIIFTGLRRDVPEILGITDILVLPSLREGLPMILLEAMAAGAVVVATKVGGTPELVVDSGNGFLAEPGSPASLQAALNFALERFDSLGVIRAAARATVEEKFSLSRMVLDHERIYSEITQRTKNA